MAKKLQLRGGTTTQHGSFTGALREVTVDTTLNTLVVHDNSTAGGFPLAKASDVYSVTKGSDIGSADPLVIAAGHNYFIVTGTTGFNDMTVAANTHFFLEFAGALVMTHVGGALDLPSGAAITTVAGDVGEFFATAANVVTCVSYTRADGSSLAIKNESIDSDHYVDGSIDNAHLSVNSVDSDQYVDGSIDNAHLAANSVDSDNYVDGSIDNIHIADLDAAKLTGTVADARLSTVSSSKLSGALPAISGAALTDVGAITWIGTPKTGDFTASAGTGYYINTTSSSVTVTTPSSPSAGDEFIIVDYAGTWDSNPVLVDGNGSDKILGSTDLAASTEDRGSVRMVYADSTQGWLPVSSANVETQIANVNKDLQYLVLAGGAAGGSNDNGGGGGAGGYRAGTFTPNGSTAYSVTVGAGGASSSGVTNGASGGTSSMSGTGLTTITMAGGGGGGRVSNPTGVAGGSGGGAGQNGTGGAGNTPSVSPSQGNAGGNSSPAGSPSGGAGGGGFGAVGQNCTASSGQNSVGHGGAGVSNSISGTALFYAGGGGGGSNQVAPYFKGDGGSLVGGDGQLGTGTGGSGDNAVTNRGSGGGGSGQSGGASGAGSSGVAIIKVATTYYSGTTSGSPTVTTDGAYTIMTFTGSGSYTTVA